MATESGLSCTKAGQKDHEKLGTFDFASPSQSNYFVQTFSFFSFISQHEALDDFSPHLGRLCGLVAVLAGFAHPYIM